MNEKVIWDYIFNKCKNPYGAAAMMGNLMAESSLNPACVTGVKDPEYIQKADGILSEEDYTILSESGMFDDLTKPALLPVIRGVGLRRVRSIIASSCIVIMFAGLIGVLLYVLGLVLYFVGGLSLVGIEIFADGSALGFIGAAAAVIITLGMFATLIKAILGR